MRTLPALLLVLCVACGGGNDEDCDTPSTALMIDVMDVNEEPVLEAQVELNQEPCTEKGEGVYECVATDSGEHHLYVAKFPNYRPSAQFIQVEEPDGCDMVTEGIEIRLSSYIGGN